MDTPGKRVYAIRLALGDGWKSPMTMAAFAALLTKRSGTSYDSAKISRIESGERALSIAEVDVIAAVDPQNRGREWLAWGEKKPVTVDGLDDMEAGAVLLSPAQLARAEEAVAAREAAERQAAQRARGARQPGKKAR